MRGWIAGLATGSLLLWAAQNPPALVAGQLDTINITPAASPIAGEFLAEVVGIRWDPRCLPVSYRVNNTLNPIPNPLGAAFLTLADATQALQASLDSWNRISTSYIDLRIAGTTSNPGPAGFDFVNELTFREPLDAGIAGFSPSVSLVEPTFLAAGDDVDGDGDSDVSAGIATCRDTDADGDVEFPAGFYQAGTILENDVKFNVVANGGFRFTVADAAVDGEVFSVDLTAVATHELGHSHGLSHTALNVVSSSDGTDSTMYPFLNTLDPDTERAYRSLGDEDVAWSSFLYQEGTAASGPAALQAGDVSFASRYGVISGSVTDGATFYSVAGASVFAVQTTTGKVTATAVSGKPLLSYNPQTGFAQLLPLPLGVPSGEYRIPVPAGSYRVGVEALDGLPVPGDRVNITGLVGLALGQLTFQEEFWNGAGEGAFELKPGDAATVAVAAGATSSGVSFLTNVNQAVGNFGDLTRGFLNAPAGSWYAVRIPASRITAVNPGGGILVQAALFGTSLVDSSQVPRYAQALLTTGRANATGTATINLAAPLASTSQFLAQDTDFSPLYFSDPRGLGQLVRTGLQPGQDLFAVLRVPTQTPFAGFNRFPPLILIDGPAAGNDVPIAGDSYFSSDGVTFNQDTQFNYAFSLLVAADR